MKKVKNNGYMKIVIVFLPNVYPGLNICHIPHRIGEKLPGTI